MVRIRGQSSADRNIASVVEEGIYRTERHLHLLRKNTRSVSDPDAFVAAHVRRLEALRRAGIVERVEAGVWRVPPDLIERGSSYDARPAVEVLSHLPIERQVKAIGATWLDRQLVNDSAPALETGFSGEVRTALRLRLAFLVEHGLADQQDSRVILRGNLLVRLRDHDLEIVAKKMATESGLFYQPARDGHRIAGCLSTLSCTREWPVCDVGRWSQF